MTNEITNADVRRQIQDGATSSGAIDGEMFDRWLAEHDRVVSAAAWREGVTAESDYHIASNHTDDPPSPVNPYLALT